MHFSPLLVNYSFQTFHFRRTQKKKKNQIQKVSNLQSTESDTKVANSADCAEHKVVDDQGHEDVVKREHLWVLREENVFKGVKGRRKKDY